MKTTWHYQEREAIDAVARRAGEHLAIFPTAVVNGVRSIIGFHLLPHPGPDRVRERVSEVLDFYEGLPPETFTRMGSVVLREVGMREVFEARLQCLREDDALRYLDDALTYAKAVSRGEPGIPAVREARGISRTRASQRIQKAREHGLLTEPVRKGKLVMSAPTEKAYMLADRRRIINAYR